MIPSPLAVRLLSACCAHPQTQAEVEAVLWRRGFPLALTERALAWHLHALRETGYLEQIGPAHALTPAGEALLDEMWGAA